MDKETKSPTECRAWNALVPHHQKVRDVHLHKLFVDDSSTNDLIRQYRKFKEVL